MNEQKNNPAAARIGDGKIDAFLEMCKTNKPATKEELARLLYECQIMRKETENGFVKKLLGDENSKKLLDLIDEAEPEILRRFKSID